MTKFTNEICKDFLISRFPQTKTSDWKQQKHYININQLFVFDFYSEIVQKRVLVKENTQLEFGIELIVVPINFQDEEFNHKTNKKEEILNSINLSNIVGNTLHFSKTKFPIIQQDPIELFKTILDEKYADNTLFTYDLISQIELDELVQTYPNILEQYLFFILDKCIYFIDFCDKELPMYLGAKNYKDCLSDLINVFYLLQQYYVDNKKPISIHHFQYSEYNDTLLALSEIITNMEYTIDESLLIQAQKNFFELNKIFSSYGLPQN